jgi:putative transposase
MRLANLLRGGFDAENEDVWENERTPTPDCFAVRLHSRGLSLREVEVILEWLGVDC